VREKWKGIVGVFELGERRRREGGKDFIEREDDGFFLEC
jgi:hypothetical protein